MRGMTEDRFRGRQPTSHERMTGLPWDASYDDGPAPWDVGPQPAVVRVASEGGFTGRVLDAGCGSGENALHLASLGLSVLGVDVTEAGGTLHLLCFADEGDGDPGPHPVSKDDLTRAFGSGTGWSVVDISPERVHTRFHDDVGAPAWLATITREGH